MKNCYQSIQVLIVALIGVLPLSLNAQSLTGPAGVLEETVQPELLGFTFKSGYSHTFGSGLSAGAGRLAVDRATTGLSYFQRYDTGFLSISADYQYDWNQFSGPALFGNTQETGFNIYYTHRIVDNWGVFVLAAGGFAAETAADLSRGGQFSIALGPTYRFSESLSLYAGPLYRTRLENSGQLIGVLGVDWKINPHWALRTFNGGVITYDVFADRATVIDASVEYQTSQLRLRTNPLEGGIGSDNALAVRQLTFGLGVTQTLGERFYVRVHCDVSTLRRYQFRSNGNSSSQFDASTGVTVGIQGGVNF